MLCDLANNSDLYDLADIVNIYEFARKNVIYVIACSEINLRLNLARLRANGLAMRIGRHLILNRGRFANACLLKATAHTNQRTFGSSHA